MKHTDRYRQQHAEIMTLATQLSKRLSPATLVDEAAEVRKLLGDLAAKIVVHLAAEDTVLYPKLFNSKNSATQALAKRFANEMGLIAQTFRAYVTRWATETAIRSKPEDFAKESQAIIKALGERIRRENTELYPLADQPE
jgi:hypothetical protein